MLLDWKNCGPELLNRLSYWRASLKKGINDAVKKCRSFFVARQCGVGRFAFVPSDTHPFQKNKQNHRPKIILRLIWWSFSPRLSLCRIAPLLLYCATVCGFWLLLSLNFVFYFGFVACLLFVSILFSSFSLSFSFADELNPFINAYVNKL